MRTVKKMGICAFFTMVVLLSLMITAFASNISYSKGIPEIGLHADLTSYQTKPTNLNVRNYCSEAKDIMDDGTIGPLTDRLWDFWVDQDGNGQVFDTRSINRSTTVIAAYSKTLTSSQVIGRCSTRSLLDSGIQVKGTVDFNYSN